MRSPCKCNRREYDKFKCRYSEQAVGASLRWMEQRTSSAGIAGTKHRRRLHRSQSSGPNRLKRTVHGPSSGPRIPPYRTRATTARLCSRKHRLSNSAYRRSPRRIRASMGPRSLSHRRRRSRERILRSLYHGRPRRITSHPPSVLLSLLSAHFRPNSRICCSRRLTNTSLRRVAWGRSSYARGKRRMYGTTTS
jgi:hypothetical protein